jgi:TorA maturation chaperone TorD
MNEGLTKQKAETARLLAWLLTQPDEEMVEALSSGEIYRFFAHYLGTDNGNALILKELLPEDEQTNLLNKMKEEYQRLFQNPISKDWWWVESVHKRWTNDPDCGLPLAKEKGYVMGDSALHMIELYRSLGIRIPDEFSGMPDHIILELEFLALLLESCSEDAVKTFLKDHLDWIPEMMRCGRSHNPSPFYQSVFALIERVIQSETMQNRKEATINAG